jgi:hypothetical protein
MAPFEEGVVTPDVTRQDQTAIEQPGRDDDVLPMPDFKRLEWAAQLPVRRHRRREYAAPDER